jgi:Domain of unknown function (DUF4382)
MQRRSFNREASRASRTCLVAALFFCLGLFGCSNYCFVFVSNPGGSISTSTPSCQLNTATGTVRLRITASPTATASAEAAAPTVQHIFVTLRGIEAIASTIADDDSPEWRELAPKLAAQPEQLDLLARSVESCERGMFEDVAVPADAYRQIRLRLTSNQPATDDSVPEENACGSIGFNCVVTSDGGTRPLRVDHLASQFQIPSDHISDGFFRVLPEATVNLNIEFNPQSTLIFSADDPVRLVPVFTVEPQAPCEPATAPNQ